MRGGDCIRGLSENAGNVFARNTQQPPVWSNGVPSQAHAGEEFPWAAIGHVRYGPTSLLCLSNKVRTAMDLFPLGCDDPQLNAFSFQD